MKKSPIVRHVVLPFVYNNHNRLSEDPKDHNISVEPYEYNDRNCAVTMNMTDFNKLIDGKLDPVVAFTIGKLKVDGDVGKALEFSTLLK